MTTSCLQEKIDKLQNTVHALLHKSNYMAGVYVGLRLCRYAYWICRANWRKKLRGDGDLQ